MAGNLDSDSVIWVAGESDGKDETGATATIPGDNITVTFAAGVPSSAPNGSPFYVNTSTNKFYVWNGTSWVAASGANN